MRKITQWLLGACALAALILTGVAFYQIVLASTIHGAPVRYVERVAGPYHLKVTLYNNPINAGDAIPFALAVTPGTPGPLTYVVTASPGPGVPGSLAQGDVNARQTTAYGVPGSITFVTRGPWTLNIAIAGPLGRATAAIPLTVVAPPAMPGWLAWAIGLVPVFGLLLFWWSQTRRATHPDTGRSADEGERPVPT